LKPSITGPPRIPEKIIVAAKTGPPALPAKPRMQAERGYMNELNRYNSNNLSRQSLLALDTNFKGGFNYSSSSVNTSTVSSPSVVHMPAMVSRTGTGDSSLSLSSQSSASVKKNGWHSIGSFFPANSNTPDEHTTLKNSIQRPSSTITEDILISPQVSGTKATQKSEAKRKNVISELLKTERVYQSDMIVLKEVYYDGSKSATDCFTTLDIRILFSNLLDIVEFEKSFVALLENACEESISDEVDSTSVGTAFREMVSK
jgi:hypothetical protein